MMQNIVCEMCGSNDVVKDNDTYICQNCGTRFSPKPNITNNNETYTGPVDIQNLHVDSSVNVNNLVILLDRSISNQQWDEVAKYSENILQRDPNNWKAIFFKELGQAWESPCSDIRQFKDLIPATDTALKIVEYNNTENILEVKNYLANHLLSITPQLVAGSKEEYHINKQAVYNFWDVLLLAIDINEYCINLVYENQLYNIYENIVYYASELEVKRRYDTPDFYEFAIPTDDLKNYAQSKKDEYTQKLRQDNSNYVSEEVSGDRCYIATAVYGSYNCPEVWTLRRFRDETLYRHVIGRIFIRAYYSISPHIVKYFGKTRTFNKIFKKPLDVLVNRLQESHVKSDYYVDAGYKTLKEKQDKSKKKKH